MQGKRLLQGGREFISFGGFVALLGREARSCIPCSSTIYHFLCILLIPMFCCGSYRCGSGLVRAVWTKDV